MITSGQSFVKVITYEKFLVEIRYELELQKTV